MRYEEFINNKAQLSGGFGFEPLFMPDFLFDFQSHLTGWGIRQGRGALLEDCGLGKTPQELVWSENVVRHANKGVLILTPIAVSSQMEKEAEKFGIEAKKSRDGKPCKNITITNYEQHLKGL